MNHLALDQNSIRRTGLFLCLRRVHGRAVDLPPMAVLAEGMVIGGDGGAADLGASLHVGARHAVVRHHRETGEYRIEPGSQALVLAVNDVRVPWGSRVALLNGDRVEVGFAQFVVSVGPADAPADMSGWGPAVAATPGAEGPVRCTAASAACTADQSACAGLPELSTQSEPPNASAGPDPSDAAVLAAMLAPASGGEGGPRSNSDGPRTVLDVLVGRVAPAVRPEPDDILAALSAESVRVLAGETTGLAASAPPVMPAAAAASGPDPFQAGAAMASVEDILEGPLTIDDVLERLRQHSGTVGPEWACLPARTGVSSRPCSPYPEHTGQENPGNPLDELVRVPDPLLLLAGMEHLPPREPELAPVLHREHRATGIQTPYRLHAVALVTESPPQEEPCPQNAPQTVR